MDSKVLHFGEQAPQFTTVDIYNKPLSLENYKNKKILLCFFRYAGCPFCGVAFLKLIKEYNQLKKKGLHTIAFFQSPKESIIKYIMKFQPTFPIVADPQKKFYKLYRIPSTLLSWPRSLVNVPEVVHGIIHDGLTQGTIDGDPNLIPASFLIGPPELTLYQTYYGKTFLDVFSLEDIDEFLTKTEK